MLAGAPSAHAQPSLLVVSVDVEDPNDPLGHGNETLLDVTVHNQGTMNGTARLNATAHAPSWFAEMTTKRVDLAPGEAKTIPVRVSAPDTRNGSASGSGVTVRAALSQASSQLTARDQDTTHVDLDEPRLIAPESGSWLLPGGLWASVVLGSGLVTWRVFASRKQLEIEVSELETVRAGEETHLPITVRNPTGEPVDVDLHLQGVPHGWPAALGTSQITLAAHQETNVWLSIAPQEPSETYPVQLRIVAEPVDDDLKPAVATVQIRVASDDGHGPPDWRLPPGPR